jgi:hypothetical protein
MPHSTPLVRRLRPQDRISNAASPRLLKPSSKMRRPRLAGTEYFALDLKVWRDRRPGPLPEGLNQLSSYLDRLHLGTGTLLLFDGRSNAAPLPERCSKERVEHRGHMITVLQL